MDEEIVFHLLHLSFLNNFIFFTPCHSKLSHRNIRLALVGDLIKKGGRLPQPQTTIWQRPTASTSQPNWLEI
jgi:hypothetical protein